MVMTNRTQFASSSEASAAALWLVPFSLLCAVYVFASPPTEAEIAACDAIVRVLLEVAGLWSLPAIGLAVAAGWAVGGAVPPQELRGSLRMGAIAVAAISVALPLLRLVVGPQLPTFVPLEEGARPGLLLGLGAGVVEEALFRLLLLPALFVLSSRVMRRNPAAVVAALATGILFALAHEIGPNATAFDPQHFAVRTILPGAAFSLVAIHLYWAIPVAGHCFAHVLLPLLFD